MAFDIYDLIQSKEVREYLRTHRKFKASEQEVIIYNTVKKLIEEGEIWKESGIEVDVVELSYPILDRYDEFLTYDWIERADAVN